MMRIGIIGIAIVASLVPVDIAAAQADRNAAARGALARLVLRLETDRAAGLAEVSAGKAAPPGIRLFCADADGRLVAHPGRGQIGRDIATWVDREGRPFGLLILKTARASDMIDLRYVLTRRPACPTPRYRNGRPVPTGCEGIRLPAPTQAVVTRASDLTCVAEYASPVPAAAVPSP